MSVEFAFFLTGGGRLDLAGVPGFWGLLALTGLACGMILRRKHLAFGLTVLASGALLPNLPARLYPPRGGIAGVRGVCIGSRSSRKNVILLKTEAFTRQTNLNLRDRKMKILITGGAGYLGSVLATQLLAEAHAVRVLDCLMYGRDSLAGLNGNSSFELIAGDLRDRDVTSRALQDMDAVVHLAAIVGDPACARNPELARAVNLDAAMQLIELAEHSGIQRFIFASTCSNYGRIPEQSAAVNEDSELKPVSLYAETKVSLERRLLAKQSHSFIPTVLRFATLYGLSPRMRFDLTVNEFTHSLFLERRLVVYGEQFWKPYVHVFDAARAISRVLGASADIVRERVFNVGDTNENYRKSDLLRIILDQIGKAEIQYVPQGDDPRDYRVSCARIQDELDFRISKRVPDGVNEIIGALNAGVRPARSSYNVESVA